MRLQTRDRASHRISNAHQPVCLWHVGSRRVASISECVYYSMEARCHIEQLAGLAWLNGGTNYDDARLAGCCIARCNARRLESIACSCVCVCVCVLVGRRHERPVIPCVHCKLLNTHIHKYTQDTRNTRAGTCAHSGLGERARACANSVPHYQ